MPDPASPPPATRQGTDISGLLKAWDLICQFKWWFTSVVTAAGSLWAAIKWERQLDEWLWVAIAGGVTPMVVAGLFNLLPEVLRILRDRRLRRWAVDLTEAEPGYFRLWPWTEDDRDRFSRPDEAEKRVFEWVRDSELPLLYLTGSSGTGKSSLLNAYVIPKLREAVGTAPYASLVVRSFDDTLADLKKQLLNPHAPWHDPELSRKRKLRTLLQAVCESLQSEAVPRQLLLVFDQFEELMILHEQDDPRVEEVREFLAELVDKPVPGLKVLLTLRSDYEHLLETLGLPPQDRVGTWEKVGAFRATDVRRFLTHSDSGINPQPAVLDAVIEEAQIVDDTRGLVRPIVMNMLGRVLKARAGETPREFEPGTLLSRHIRGCIESSAKSEHLPVILRQLIQQDAGTKRPRTVGEISEATGLAPYLIHGCLRELNDEGLVRPLTDDDDVAGRTWEVAHDFIARLLGPILETPHRTLWQKTRPALAPVSLALWLTVFPALLWNYLQGEPRRLRDQLSNLGVTVEQLQADGTYKATFAYKTVESVDEQVSLLVAHGGIIEVDLSQCRQLASLDVTGLNGLVKLDLTYCYGLESLDVTGLNGLQTLYLAHCYGLESLDVTGLNGLQTLYLSGSSGLASLDVTGLTSLQTLLVYDCTQLTSLDVTGLTSLQTLDLTGCDQLTSLDVTGLNGLVKLDLNECRQLASLDVTGLNGLQTLALTGCDLLTSLDVTGLNGLVKLDLTSCRQLASLDVTGLTSLQTLDLRSCDELASLDVTRLNGLKELDLTSCTQLTSLDVTGLNDLRKLDLSDCSGITQIRGFPLPELRLLYLTGTGISSVTELSTCERLVALSLVECKAVTDLNTLASLKNLRLLCLGGLDEQVIQTGPASSDSLTVIPDSTSRFLLKSYFQEAIQKSAQAAAESR